MIKNRKGFTLIELLATIVVLSIVVGLSVVGVNYAIQNAKNKTEDIFVKSISDALEIYIDTDAKKLNFSSSAICTVNKTHAKGVKVYKSTNALTFNNVVDSTYVPLVRSELVNPANKDVECNLNNPIEIYRDEDFVYYYKMQKNGFNCLKESGVISNLPSGCNG